MLLNDYQERAMRTAKRSGFREDIIHAALGLAGESGEFVDAVKKHTVYNRPFDSGNAIEELGDALWFVALACTTLNVTLEEIAQINIDKLKLRYPDRYSDLMASKRMDKVA